MKKLYFIGILFSFLINISSYGEVLDLPLFNPNMMSFFNNELVYIMERNIDQPGDVYQFGAGGFFEEIDTNKIIQATTGFLIPYNKVISFPIHFSLLSSSQNIQYYPAIWPIEPIDHFEMFAGSGLVLTFPFLSVGGFVGYYELNGDIGLNYTVVPVIKTDWFLKTIKGYLQTDFTNMSFDTISDSLMYLSLTFRDFSIGKYQNQVFQLYAYNGKYNWKVKNTILGLKIGTKRLTFEGGYRYFYDNDTAINYEPTPFVKAGLSFEYWGVQVGLDRYNTPSIGLILLKFPVFNEDLDVSIPDSAKGNWLIEFGYKQGIDGYDPKITFTFNMKAGINWTDYVYANSDLGKLFGLEDKREK